MSATKNLPQIRKFADIGELNTYLQQSHSIIQDVLNDYNLYVRGKFDSERGHTHTGGKHDAPNIPAGAVVLNIEEDGTVKIANPSAINFTTGLDAASVGGKAVISVDVSELQVASATQLGILSAADWSTFNAKQPAGNYVVYTGATGDVNLGIYDLTASGLTINYMTGQSMVVEKSAVWSNSVFRQSTSAARTEFWGGGDYNTGAYFALNGNTYSEGTHVGTEGDMYWLLTLASAKMSFQGSAKELFRIANTGLLATESLTINLNSAVATANLTGTAISCRGADNGTIRIATSSYGVAGMSGFANLHARGTMASPLAVQSTDTLFSLEGWGYGTTGYSASPRAFIRGYASETWTDTNQGAYLSFWSSGNTTVVPVRQWSILSTGNLVSGLDGTGSQAILTAGTIGAGAITGSSLKATGLTSGRIPYVTTNGLLTNSANLVWDNTNGRLGVGTPPYNPLHVYSPLPSGPDTNLNVPLRFDKVTAATNQILSFMIGSVKTTGDMAYGFGGRFKFLISDNMVSDQEIAAVAGIRDGEDGLGTLILQVSKRPNILEEALRIRSSGNVGIGLTDPTAFLHIKAGTTAASTSPIKLTSGSLMTNPEVGAIEFLSDNLYFTITTGVARKKILLAGGETDPVFVAWRDGNKLVAGNGASGSGTASIALGSFANAGEDGISIGYNTLSTSSASIAIGTNAKSYKGSQIAIGNNATCPIGLDNNTIELGIGTATISGLNYLSFPIMETSGRLYVNSGIVLGNLGIGQASTPTALIHLAAGTTSNAPIKLTSGSLMTNPEVGAIEFLSDDLYFTITTGVARKKILLAGGETDPVFVAWRDGNKLVAGSGASGSGTNVVSLGNSAAANFLYGIAIGNGAAASDDYTTAIGFGASAGRDYSISIGHSAKTYKERTIAIGYNAVCPIGLNDDTVEIGSGTATISGLNYLSFPIMETSGRLYVNSGLSLGNFELLSDSAKLFLGAGNDMSIWYDGTNGQIKTDDVAASDLKITCGSQKTLELQNPVYDDIICPMVVGKTGSSNVPTWQTLVGVLSAYRFQTDDYLETHTEIPHTYKEGTDIEVHIHWATNGVDVDDRAVKWEAIYSIVNMGTGAFSGTTTLTGQSTITASTTDRTHMYTSMSATIAGTGRKIGDIIVLRIRRIAATGVLSAPSANPFGLNLGLHHQIDTMGSRQIGIK